jgi:hypothetical protein
MHGSAYRKGVLMGVRDHPLPEESAVLQAVNAFTDFGQISTKAGGHSIRVRGRRVRVTTGGRCFWGFGDWVLQTRYNNEDLRAELLRRERLNDWDTNVRLE